MCKVEDIPGLYVLMGVISVMIKFKDMHDCSHSKDFSHTCAARDMVLVSVFGYSGTDTDFYFYVVPLLYIAAFTFVLSTFKIINFEYLLLILGGHA